MRLVHRTESDAALIEVFSRQSILGCGGSGLDRLKANTLSNQ